MDHTDEECGATSHDSLMRHVQRHVLKILDVWVIMRPHVELTKGADKGTHQRQHIRAQQCYALTTTWWCVFEKHL